MCKKSHKKLQAYLKAILSKNSDEKFEKFVNTELNVVVTPLRGYDEPSFNFDNADSENVQIDVHQLKEKRKRITKEQRCSLLKRLLTNKESNKKNCDKYFYNYYKSRFSENIDKGGLRNIINFTKNYEFGDTKNFHAQSTPLDKLKAFSEQFFQSDFSDFRNTILYLIENKDNLDDSGDSEDDLFDIPSDKESDITDHIVKFEEVIVEPDLKIKSEIDFENEDEGECTGYGYEYYDEHSDQMPEKIKMEVDHHLEDTKEFSKISSEHYHETFGTSSSNSMQILNDFVGSYVHRRTFYSNNIRCRTRENPYINPLLKEQFLYRSFKCDKCSRYFKSQGYLKAHYTKIH